MKNTGADPGPPNNKSLGLPNHHHNIMEDPPTEKATLLLVGTHNLIANAGKTRNKGPEPEPNHVDNSNGPEHNTGPNSPIIKNETSKVDFN